MNIPRRERTNLFYIITLLVIFLFVIMSYIVRADTTARIGMTLHETGEIQPDKIINKNLYRLDALIFPMLADYPASASPDTIAAEEGDLFVVPSGATGAWNGHDNDLAILQNGAWAFIDPATGWVVSTPVTIDYGFGISTQNHIRSFQYANEQWNDVVLVSMSDTFGQFLLACIWPSSGDGIYHNQFFVRNTHAPGDDILRYGYIGSENNIAAKFGGLFLPEYLLTSDPSISDVSDSITLQYGGILFISNGNTTGSAGDLIYKYKPLSGAATTNYIPFSQAAPYTGQIPAGSVIEVSGGVVVGYH